MNQISLRQIRNHLNLQGSRFETVYEKFVANGDVDDDDLSFLLELAIVFLNQDDKGLVKFGYSIILSYCNKYQDYIPLYDIALSQGFIPISKFIEKKFLNKEVISESFHKTMLSLYKDTFKYDGYYLSSGQKGLMDFSKSCQDFVIVAPTSYGKSEMIIDKVINRILENPDSSICILVPSKALLSQTRIRLYEGLKAKGVEDKRILTHPEMYKESLDDSVLAVFTQERLLRLIQEHKEIKFDLAIVDEAHNLMEKDFRAILLMQTLIILKKRNPSIELNFFTPFIADSESIHSKYIDYSMNFKSSDEFMKIERLYMYNSLDGEFMKYDQFLNSVISLKTLDCNEIEFVKKFSANKNIVYLNRPKHVEEVALLLCKNEDSITNPKIDKALKSISNYLHKDYSLIKTLKHGVMYHHGKVPEVVRLYIEKMYKDHGEFRYVVTTSTLLEGVNIPAEKMFILSPSKGRGYLSKSSFKNLVGRVCRFKDVFSNVGSLKLLEPEIYIINGEYCREDFDLKSFVSDRANLGLTVKDEVKNIFLIDEIKGDENKNSLHNALEVLENIESGSVSTSSDIVLRLATTDIGKSCFNNNVTEFDITDSENILNDNINALGITNVISSVEAIIDAIYKIFIVDITHKKNEEFLRLKDEKVRYFYSKLLRWRVESKSYSQMINHFVYYWDNVYEGDGLIYVGSAWGEVTRGSDGFSPMWVDLNKKSDSAKVNLAIVRIKEEYDFIEYHLIKYVEILNDLNLVSKSLYESIKYATDNSSVICLLKNGVSMELAKLIVSGYSEYLQVDLKSDVFVLLDGIEVAMRLNEENDIYVFEIGFHH